MKIDESIIGDPMYSRKEWDTERSEGGHAIVQICQNRL